MNLKDHIRHVPDFPKPGILFYDISTLLAHAEAWKEAVKQLHAIVAPLKPDLLVGIESRGFLVAAPLALELGIGFVMVRKKANCRGQPSATATRWSMARIPSKFRKMRFGPVSASWC